MPVPPLVQWCFSRPMRRSTIDAAFQALLSHPFLTQDRGRREKDTARDPVWDQLDGHPFARSQLAGQRHSHHASTLRRFHRFLLVESFTWRTVCFLVSTELWPGNSLWRRDERW